MSKARLPCPFHKRLNRTSQSLIPDITACFTEISDLAGYQGRMIASLFRFTVPPRILSGAVLLALGAGLAGCSSMSDGMTSMFADPAKYDLYDCKQLQAERKSLATRMAELQGLMAKAQAGAAGPVVAEVAYSNDYVALRGQSKNADEAWVRNKCREMPVAKPAEAAEVPASGAPKQPAKKSGSAVY